MQVAYKNMIDTAGLNVKTQHLLLRAFAAIDKVKMLVNVKRLCGWIPVKDWRCRTTPQYCYLKLHDGKQQRVITSPLSSTAFQLLP